MIEEQDPLLTVKKLISKRYPQAKSVIWAGSVKNNQATESSDLDLIIVFESLPNAYREAFIYDGWPVDTFIHDLDSLNYFFEESRVGNGITGLAYMIINGYEILDKSEFTERVKRIAQESIALGPALWDKDQIDKERFLITDALDDIKYPASYEEKMASAAWLLEALGQFYFRAQGKWCASGKNLIRYLSDEDNLLAKEFNDAFSEVFRNGKTCRLELLVQKILLRYGGLLWDGYSSKKS